MAGLQDAPPEFQRNGLAQSRLAQSRLGYAPNAPTFYVPGFSVPIIYVPWNEETPGWVAPALSLGASEPIQLALNLAKELKDYKSQVACYKLLIIQSQDPTQLFGELAHLQKSRQGDKQGHLETLLSSYVVCKDSQAKENLLEELEQTDDWGDATVLYWTRDFIERALKRSLQGPKSKARLRYPPSFYISKGLPLEAGKFTWQNADFDGDLPITQYPMYPLQPHIQQTYLADESHTSVG